MPWPRLLEQGATADQGHETINLRTGGNIAWAIRKGSPQFKAAADDFVVRHAKGTSIGNQLLTKYLKNTNQRGCGDWKPVK